MYYFLSINKIIYLVRSQITTTTKGEKRRKIINVGVKSKTIKTSHLNYLICLRQMLILINLLLQSLLDICIDFLHTIKHKAEKNFRKFTNHARPGVKYRRERQ